MELDKVQQLQYAVACFKEFSHAKSQLSLIWKTNHGFATFDSYQTESDKLPIISEKVINKMIYKIKTVPYDSSNMFAVVRDLVYTKFEFNNGNDNQFLIEEPYILFGKIKDVIDSNNLSEKNRPNNKTVWNVSFVESNVSLPFLDFSLLGNVEPVSLALESSTDTE